MQKTNVLNELLESNVGKWACRLVSEEVFRLRKLSEYRDLTRKESFLRTLYSLTTCNNNEIKDTLELMHAKFRREDFALAKDSEGREVMDIDSYIVGWIMNLAIFYFQDFK